jgi:hypothetical protein
MTAHNSSDILEVRTCNGTALRMSFHSDDAETVQLFADGKFNRNVELLEASQAAHNWLADVASGEFALIWKSDEALRSIL